MLALAVCDPTAPPPPPIAVLLLPSLRWCIRNAAFGDAEAALAAGLLPPVVFVTTAMAPMLILPLALLWLRAAISRCCWGL